MNSFISLVSDDGALCCNINLQNDGVTTNISINPLMHFPTAAGGGDPEATQGAGGGEAGAAE